MKRHAHTDDTERWYPPSRCMECGHRVEGPSVDYRPIPTRAFPVWWWPFELVNRLQARLVNRLTPEQQFGSVLIPDSDTHRQIYDTVDKLRHSSKYGYNIEDIYPGMEKE